MTRTLIAGLLLLSLAAAAPAQEWARKMFKETQHDFGTVARGAKTEFRFELQNLYIEDIHLSSVRASCGCTTPFIEKDTLKTWEKGAIRARFNTDTFSGQRSATLTVVIDKPYYAEVQLTVQGYIRSDVVFNPGEVNFGELEQGNTAEQRVSVAYAGRGDWSIVDVRSARDCYEVALSEPRRVDGRVEYQMTVRLKDNAEAGYYQDDLTIVTNDRSLRTIPLSVQGRVLSPLTVSPASLVLGVLQPGESVTRRLVVRAKQPFTIMDIKCPDGGFKFELPEGAKTLHFVPLTFTAGNETGQVIENIQIVTDLPQSGVATCRATATVKEVSGE